MDLDALRRSIEALDKKIRPIARRQPPIDFRDPLAEAGSTTKRNG
jgi:hypothetical protein